MRRTYKNLEGDSGIRTYEILADSILIEFATGKYRYLYNATRPGPEHVAAMQKLATKGRGLATYINQHVRDAYAAKIPLPNPRAAAPPTEPSSPGASGCSAPRSADRTPGST